jgi:hypothetical protein
LPASLTFKSQHDTELGDADLLYYAGTPLKKALAEDPKPKEAPDVRSAPEKLAEALFDQRLAFVREQRGSDEADVQKQRREILDSLIAERPEDPEPLFEKALLLAMDAGLAGKWWKGSEAKDVNQEAAAGDSGTS